MLSALGLLTGGMPASELLGKIALQSVPASIGAMLGRSQLGDDDDEDDDGTGETRYPAELLMMAAGALFLSLNIAPTDEMLVLAYKMTIWHAIVVTVLSVALMHGFVYAVSFTGGHELSPETPWWHAFVRFTLPGYVIALAISRFALWIFERLGDSSTVEIMLSSSCWVFRRRSAPPRRGLSCEAGMTKTEKGRHRERHDPHWIEWLTGIVSAILVAGMIGWLGWEAFTREATPPELSIAVLVTKRPAAAIACPSTSTIRRPRRPRRSR